MRRSKWPRGDRAFSLWRWRSHIDGDLNGLQEGGYGLVHPAWLSVFFSLILEVAPIHPPIHMEKS